MLTALNEKLNGLRGKMAQCEKTEAMINELRAQEKELTARVGELASLLQIEQEDVDRLTGGFWSIYYAIIGKREEMLEKERAEALAASMKYETAKKELEAVQQEIFSIQLKSASVKQLEREYRAALMEKVEVMKTMSAYAEKIVELEEKKGYLEIQIREVGEAREAGRRVLGQIDRIESSLDSAEGWGTWDLFGGGVISDIAKYSHLDEAQAGAQNLEALLRRFKTELADITIQADLAVPTDGFLRFADWFFDGFFVDWTVLSRIRESKESLKSAQRQVQKVMDQLHRMENAMKRKQEELDFNIRTLAEEA